MRGGEKMKGKGREGKGKEGWERERKEEFIPQCSLAVDATGVYLSRSRYIAYM